MRIFLTIFGLLLAPATFAEDYAAIVERAFAAIDSDFHSSWAFTESSLEEGVTVTGRYDPRRPEGERWSLLSVDGRTPGEDEIEDYLDDKEDDYQWDNDHSDDGNDEFELVDFDTLELVEETDEHWLFSFIPAEDNEEDEEARDVLRKIVGSIKVVRDGHYLEYLDLRNDKPIRPAFSVRISRFLTRLTFGPAGGDGPIVPLKINVEVKGRALLVVTFNETESITYSGYEHVGD